MGTGGKKKKEEKEEKNDPRQRVREMPQADPRQRVREMPGEQQEVRVRSPSAGGGASSSIKKNISRAHSTPMPAEQRIQHVFLFYYYYYFIFYKRPSGYPSLRLSLSLSLYLSIFRDFILLFFCCCHLPDAICNISFTGICMCFCNGVQNKALARSAVVTSSSPKVHSSSSSSSYSSSSSSSSSLESLFAELNMKEYVQAFKSEDIQLQGE